MKVRPGVVEVSVAAILLAAAVIELLVTEHSSPLAADALAAVATTVPLAWRSAFPVPVVAVTTGGLAAAALLGVPAGELIVPYLAPRVAVFCVGSISAVLSTKLTFGVATSTSSGSAPVDARASAYRPC